MSRNSSLDINALLSRIDSLERALQHLQGNVTQLQALLSTSAQPHPHHVAATTCNKTTQTEHSHHVSPPMDLETLAHKIGQCQNEDRNIFMLKYLLEQDIKPKAKEILNFEPKMRRLLWQFPRFFLKDGKLFRKRMGSDRVTEQHQLVVPANMVPDVLNTFHPLDGHMTLECSISTITEHFFWPSVKQDTTRFASMCSTCQAAKSREPPVQQDQMPASAIQAAVCAITELTKDFIRHADPCRILKRKRGRKNQHTSRNNRKPAAANLDSQMLQSPPRVQQPQSPEIKNPWQDLSSLRASFSRDQQYFAHLDYGASSPPRDYHSRSPRARDHHRYHSPPQYYSDYSPSRGRLYHPDHSISSPDRWRD